MHGAIATMLGVAESGRRVRSLGNRMGRGVREVVVLAVGPVTKNPIGQVIPAPLVAIDRESRYLVGEPTDSAVANLQESSN